MLKSLINLRNICRMCGERYDEGCKSVDIFQPGADNGPSYADLMKIHLDLEVKTYCKLLLLFIHEYSFKYLA
jgi:hypothetical protein